VIEKATVYPFRFMRVNRCKITCTTISYLLSLVWQQSPMAKILSWVIADPLNFQSRSTHAAGSGKLRPIPERSVRTRANAADMIFVWTIGKRKRDKTEKDREGKKEKRVRKKKEESTAYSRGRRNLERALSSRGSRGTVLTSRPWGARISCRQDLHPHRPGATRRRYSGPVDQQWIAAILKLERSPDHLPRMRTDYMERIILLKN